MQNSLNIILTVSVLIAPPCELPNRKSLSFKGNLLRAKIECEILNEDEIYNLIYRELNKNSALNISNLSKGGNLYVDKKQRTKRNRYF